MVHAPRNNETRPSKDATVPDSASSEASDEENPHQTLLQTPLPGEVPIDEQTPNGKILAQQPEDLHAPNPPSESRPNESTAPEENVPFQPLGPKSMYDSRESIFGTGMAAMLDTIGSELQHDMTQV
mmetsp:Transcript_106515/g.148464  ORF Transcript_106515/g.148464 Transcript_106515/m.148464 type:complete len:126 (-) Transcript_106515:19-396(-)